MANSQPGTNIVLARDRLTLKKMLENKEFLGSLSDVLPKHVSKERMLKMVMIAFSRTPKLYECTMQSIYGAAIRSAELGLDCSGTLNSAHLVPFYNSKIKAREAVFIPGYGGLIDLARRSGEVSRIEAHVIYDEDKFEYRLGTDPHIMHIPLLKGARGNIYAAYAIAEMVGEVTSQVEVMTLQDIEAIRRRSKAKDDGPWVTDWSEMARKTVVKRLVKYLPLSPEKAAKLHEAIDEDNRILGLDLKEADIIPPKDSRGAGDKLAETLGAKVEEGDDEEKRKRLWNMIEDLGVNDREKMDAVFEELIKELDLEVQALDELHGEALDAVLKLAGSRVPT